MDVDILANKIDKLENQDELEHILKSLRLSRATVNTLESTHHSVCRFYLLLNKRKKLLEILNQRIEFGIFPDTYIYNILLDQCLVDENLDDGFNVVKLMMLQEDSGNEISKTLAMDIMNKMLLENKVVMAEAEEATEEPEEEYDEDEIEYIRVPYLTNPYFDDHFEITNQSHLFGKSLYFFGYEIGKSCTKSEDLTLAFTSQIVGLTFYEKWPKLNKILDKLAEEKKIPISSETLKLIEPKTSPNEEVQKELEQIRTKLSKLPTVETSMKSLIDNRCQLLPELEAKDLQAMEKLFEDFEKNRVECLQQQMQNLINEQKRKELEEKKKELDEKKRLYYFFENFPKHEIDFVEAEKRIAELKSTTIVDEDYIPPERY